MEKGPKEKQKRVEEVCARKGWSRCRICFKVSGHAKTVNGLGGASIRHETEELVVVFDKRDQYRSFRQLYHSNLPGTGPTPEFQTICNNWKVAA